MSEEEVAKKAGYASACSGLLKVPDEPVEDSAVKFPDLVDEANLIEWAGLSLGRSETYKLYLSVKKFAESLPGDVEKVRLVGKVSTLGAPYYVLEGLSDADEEGVEESVQEGRTGMNKYAYWVSQSVESGAWTKLPNVTCEQIVKARAFKKFLTGSLDAPVNAYPPFPGSEKNLLRAQLARIVGATSISPDGYFELDESEPPMVKLAEAEALAERFPKTSGELKDVEAWKHHETDPNKLGRVTALPEVLGPDGEPVEPEEPVEVPEQLTGIAAEAWSLRVCPGGSGVAAGSIVVAKSLTWPGAVAVAAGRRFVNMYVGNAVAYEAVSYSPPLPGGILGEWSPPAEEEGGDLVEETDVTVDPTPPVVEGDGEEE
jgi:radial spoke head protein 4A